MTQRLSGRPPWLALAAGALVGLLALLWVSDKSSSPPEPQAARRPAEDHRGASDLSRASVPMNDRAQASGDWSDWLEQAFQGDATKAQWVLMTEEALESLSPDEEEALSRLSLRDLYAGEGPATSADRIIGAEASTDRILEEFAKHDSAKDSWAELEAIAASYAPLLADVSEDYVAELSGAYSQAWEQDEVSFWHREGADPRPEILSTRGDDPYYGITGGYGNYSVFVGVWPGDSVQLDLAREQLDRLRASLRSDLAQALSD